MADLVTLRGPVSVANLAAAAGVTTTVDGWWPCLDITFRTPVPPSITKITAQVRERGADGRYSQPAETVLTKAEIAAGAAKIVNGVSVGQHLEIRLNPAGAPGLPFQATPWVEVTTSWDALMAALDGLSIGCVKIVCGVGVPTRTDLPIGSLYVREDIAQLWQAEQDAVPRRVQEAATGGGANFAITLGAAPTEGNWLIAFAYNRETVLAANTGWTVLGSDYALNYPSTPEGSYGMVVCKQAGAAESATQTPFTGAPNSGRGGLEIIEVAGVADLENCVESLQFDGPVYLVDALGSTSISAVTENNHALAIAFSGWWGGGSGTGPLSINSGWSNVTLAEAGSSSSELIANQRVAAAGTTVTADVTIGFAFHGMISALLVLKPDSGMSSWTLISEPNAELVASENLVAGLVHVHSGGVRQADASNGYEAHGWIASDKLSGEPVVVHFAGMILGLSGLTKGPVYLGDAGAVTSTPPSDPDRVQVVGVAVSATEVVVNLVPALDPDPDLAANSDLRIPTQKAVKAYVDANAGGGGGSGALVLLSSQTASGASSVVFDSGDITSTYDEYELHWQDVTASGSTTMGIQFSPDNGSTWRTSGYAYAYENWGLTTSFSQYVPNGSASFAIIENGLTTDTAAPSNGQATLTSLLNSGTKKMTRASSISKKGDGNVYDSRAAGYYSTAEAINAFRVIPASGTITGKFLLYGVAK